MTDKINDKKLESMKGEPLNPQDEELLKMFFSDCQMSEIPDDGFSDRVMQALPAYPKLILRCRWLSASAWNIYGRQPVWQQASS